MTSPSDESFESLAHRAYSDGFACHGDLELELEQYVSHLISIVEKYLGLCPPRLAALRFLSALHTDDLYLSVACARPSQLAWKRFVITYRRHLYRLAASHSEIRADAREVADDIMGHIFLPDGSGRSRIASYHGRCSLANWLHMVVVNRALNEGRRKHNKLERIERLPDIADEASLDRLEAAVRANRYKTLFADSLKGASLSLSDRERLVLLLRYDDGLQVSEVARIFEVSPSTVTRQLERVHRKLREQTISILASKHGLSEDAIEECLVDIFDNPAHSIIALVKEGKL